MKKSINPAKQSVDNMLETIERFIYKNGDDIAVSVSRSFERLEERVDGIESRIYSRLADMEDKACGWFEELQDKLDIVKEEKQHDTDKTTSK